MVIGNEVTWKYPMSATLPGGRVFEVYPVDDPDKTVDVTEAFVAEIVAEWVTQTNTGQIATDPIDTDSFASRVCETDTATLIALRETIVNELNQRKEQPCDS